MADYDVVVIGSGAGGLAAALKIARSDLSVLVLEAAPAFGGCMNPMEKAGYSFHIGVHYIGQLAEGDSFWRALEEIGLNERVKFLELNPEAIPTPPAASTACFSQEREPKVAAFATV